MKPRVLYRRNAADDPVDPGEAAIVAKDMIKLGDFAGADKVLRWEGGMDDEQFSNGTVGGVYLAAVVEELASGKRAVARKLFTKVRKRYRREQLPTQLYGMTRFTEANVLVDMAVALGVGTEELTIMDGVYNDDVFEIRQGRHDEYAVVKNDDAATKLAIERVTDDLEHEPEVFNQDFLERFIDQEKLQQLVRDIVMEDDYVDELKEREFWQVAKQYGMTEPDEDDDDEDDDEELPTEELKEAMADEAAGRAMDYLTDMLGGADEANTFVMERVGIDVAAAAEQAVRDDGAGHFLGTYDGELNETISGFTYWRTN